MSHLHVSLQSDTCRWMLDTWQAPRSGEADELVQGSTNTRPRRADVTATHATETDGCRGHSCCAIRGACCSAAAGPAYSPYE